jgi:hypothetical protein
LNEAKLSETENLYKEFETPEKASKLLQLQHFSKFDDTTVALAAITGSVEGKIPKSLKKVLKKISADTEETMLVADAKLGSSIKVIFAFFFVKTTLFPPQKNIYIGSRVWTQTKINLGMDSELNFVHFGIEINKHF